MATPLDPPQGTPTTDTGKDSTHTDHSASYRQVIVQLLREQGPLSPRYGTFEQQLIIDQEHDHYLLVSVGWNQDETKREYLVVMHLDLIDGKIWLQQNATEVLVDRVLLERGVPPEDIVLGLLPTFSRQHSGYSVG